MNCNIDLLTARTFHGLKSLFTPGDTLPPRYLEYLICESFGMRHVGDGNFYADGIINNIQGSIKTRMLNPHVLKTKLSRDFQTHPEKFLGPQQNAKQGIWWAGIEFVQRRQEITSEALSSERRTGLLTYRGFRQNIYESYRKFKTTQSFEILCIHGYNHVGNCYLVSVFWGPYFTPDTKNIIWGRDSNGIHGSLYQNNRLERIMYRVRDGSRREATCFKEYKDPTKYQQSVMISVPIPEQWHFDQAQILTEINYLKEKSHDNSILLTE
jgi:hypothetical protein